MALSDRIVSLPARHIRWLLVGASLLVQGCRVERLKEKAADRVPKTPQEAMVEDLRQYHDMVAAGWAYWKMKPDVNVSVTRDRLLSQVKDSTPREQFATMLQEFAAALHDGHSQVDVSSLKKPLSRTWPVGFGLLQEGILVVNLNWLRDNPGIQIGDRLVRVNGEPIEDLVTRAKHITSASTDDSRRVLAIDLLHRTNDKTVCFSLERIDGSPAEFTLPCLDHYVDYRFRDRQTFCEHSELAGRIHLIRIPRFTWNETEFAQARSDRERESALAAAKDQIDSVFSQAEQARGIILDLRGNSGGYEVLSSFVAEHLVPGDFLYYSMTRHDSEFIRSQPAYTGLEAGHFGVPLPTHPRQWSEFRHFLGVPFAGKLVVLINHRCFSTTDNLCAFLRDSRPNTQFVGQPTGAGTGEPLTVGTLTHSQVPVQFCVSIVRAPRGRVIEGTGTLPDVFIEPTRDDLLQRRDPAMDAAVTLLADWPEG